MRLKSLSAALVGAAFLTLGQLAHTETYFVVDLPETKDEIQNAIDTSAPGDVIEVGPGQFAGAEISHPVTIVGSTGTVIDEGTYYGLDAFLIHPGAAGSEIRGMTIEGVPYGVYGNFVDDIKVKNNVFIDNFNPIRIRGGSRWNIKKNIIDGLVPIGAPTPYSHRDAIVVAALSGESANDNDISKNWIRHVEIKDVGVVPEIHVGVLLIEFGTAELAGNLVEKNYVEISIVPSEPYYPDDSYGVALMSFDSSGDGVVGNMILKNKFCGSLAPLEVRPDELLASNLVEKNKFECDVYVDD